MVYSPKRTAYMVRLTEELEKVEEQQEGTSVRDPTHPDRRNHHRKCMARVPTVSE